MANKNFKENKLKRFIAKSIQPILRVFNKRAYVSLQYRYITGHKLDWVNLERFTEKLQKLRLDIYPYDDKVSWAAGRVGAREFVKQKGFEDLLVPIAGIYNSFKEIDWDKVPNQFVIKATHACAFNYICKDKNKLDVKELEKKCRRWLKTDYGKKTVELHYSKIKPQLIIEHYIGTETSLPTEYKFNVFNGTPRYLYVVTGRGQDIRYNNLDMNFEPFDGAQFNHWTNTDYPLQKPAQFEKMAQIAAILGKDFPFVRVDLYLVGDKIYFNELTFTPAKGTLILNDDSYDFLMGKWLTLPNAT